jgi:hypothetical protein
MNENLLRLLSAPSSDLLRTRKNNIFGTIQIKSHAGTRKISVFYLKRGTMESILLSTLVLSFAVVAFGQLTPAEESQIFNGYLVRLAILSWEIS